MGAGMKGISKGWLLLVAFGAALLPARGQGAQSPAPRDRDLEEELALMSFTELMNMKVISASNKAERNSEAPATVIVLGREDFEKRGYTMLSQMLDDLPGMQVSRAYGDQQVKNYWRGYRNFIGDPYLLLVDGLTQSHLWYNGVETPLTALPLSHIERVEVVYGPASAVYGANAFMGVINVITEKDRNADGPAIRVHMRAGSSQARTLDAHCLFKHGAFRFSFTARVDRHFEGVEHEAYEYTQNRYFSDRRLWGGFVDDPALGGQYRSENRSRSADLRMYWGDTELGMQYLLLKTGTGSEYAGDLVQNTAQWHRRELSLHLRHSMTLSQDLGGTTTLRYRDSGNPPESAFIDGYFDAARKGYVVAFSHWRTQNRSVTLLQDFDWRADAPLSLNFGFKFEQKDLQKAYDNPYGPYVLASELDPRTYPFPAPPSGGTPEHNRITTEDRGLYGQAHWRVDDRNILILGGRWDHNSQYKDARTLRLGFVGNYGAWGLKTLYGEGVQEPAPRILYGTWRAGSGDPRLNPERSRTVEVSGSYTERRLSALVSLWRVRNSDITIPAQPNALNLGETRITGGDLHLNLLVQPAWARQWKLWGYASFIFRSEGSNREDPLGGHSLEGLTRAGEVGDLAKRQFQAGSTLDFRIPLSLTLLARHVGARPTVATNPLPEVPAYTTLDLVATARNLGGVRGLGLTLKVSNLGDRTYFHPGISQADAGDAPGGFDASGAWRGSKGYYSSLLPQPGRMVQATLTLTY